MKAFLVCLLSLVSLVYGVEGVVIRVSDGDTITIKTDEGTTKVRLDGIDAPEAKQANGQDSKRYLSKRILNKSVEVKGSSRDKYGRLLGTVYLGNENINLTMLAKGWAWHYKQFSTRKDYADAESAARTAKVGLWSNPDALEPWKFRHPKKYGVVQEVLDEGNRSEAAQFRYWVSNSGKTHNQNCKQFYGNAGTGYYTNTPSAVDAKCCGGAGR